MCNVIILLQCIYNVILVILNASMDSTYVGR